MDAGKLQPPQRGKHRHITQGAKRTRSSQKSSFDSPSSLQPGQFQQPSPLSRPQRRTFQQWFTAQKRSAKIGLGCRFLMFVLLVCVISSVIAFEGSSSQTQAQATLTTSNTKTTGSTLAQVKPTAIPTPTPTPKPTPKPTPRPTPKPTQPPAPSLALAFTCAVAVDYLYRNVCVQTQPGAALTITVTYCSGYHATSDSLQRTVYANGSGNYVWNWEPETKCRGAATAYVNASWHGQNTSNSDEFTVS
jgi:hypothetical protein